MKNKLISLLYALLALTTYSNAQNITPGPKIDYPDNDSEFGTDNLFFVITDSEGTTVFLQHITPRICNGCWISCSSDTYIRYGNGNTCKIKEWGVYISVLENNNFISRNFDERYAVTADRQSILYLEFPPLPLGIEKFDIIEPNGWQWRGIHISNSDASKYYYRNDSDNNNTQTSAYSASGSGTGFAISTNGVIATAYHVIENANSIQVRGVNGRFDKTLNARVIATDKVNDLALLKIDDPSFVSLKAIPYNIIKKQYDVGEECFALGYPLRSVMGDEIKLTNGLISSKSGYQGDITSYQFSATVQSGNSGGPLIDKKGNIVGVINARLSDYESAAYAVKSPYLHLLVSSADEYIALPTSSTLSGLAFTDLIREIKKFVYIIETR